MRPEQALDAAVSIGDDLVERAIRSEGRSTWLGDEQRLLNGEWQVVHTAVGGDLYGGTAGIALFLGHLWQATQQDRFAEAASEALDHALRWVGNARPPPTLYEGSLGVACVAAEFGEALGSAADVETARRITDRVVFEAQWPQLPDLVGGRSGTIVALVSLARALADPSYLQTASDLGDSLAKDAEPHGYGSLAWRSLPDDPGAPLSSPLCGMAHGASGVALALTELDIANSPAAYQGTIEGAVMYERSWYDRAELNWPDLREFTRARLRADVRPQFPVFWCHGALGIGLMRLRLYEMSRRHEHAAEAEASLVNALKLASEMDTTGGSGDLSICHGLAGAVELLMEGARVFEQEQLRSDAFDILDLSVELRRRNSGFWPCGVTDGGENPSLMIGMAGIGHMFLRAARPDVSSAGLLYCSPMGSQRLVVKLVGETDPSRLQRKAEEIVASVEHAELERLSRRGRVLLRVPEEEPIEEVLLRLGQMEGVEYAELDVTDSAQDR